MKVSLQKIKVRHLPDMINTDLDNKSTESVFFCCLKTANEKVYKNKRNKEAAICYAYEKEAVIELLREQWYYIYKNVIKYSQAAFSV